MKPDSEHEAHFALGSCLHQSRLSPKPYPRGKGQDQFAVTIGCKTRGMGEGVSYRGSHGQMVRVGKSVNEDM